MVLVTDTAAASGGAPQVREASLPEIMSFVASQQKSVLTFVGFSGSGYEHFDQVRRRAVDFMLQHDPGDTLINIGATSVGIGALYEPARELGFTTMGIVSVLARERKIPLADCVNHVFYIADSRWGGRTADGVLTPTSAALVAVSDAFIAFGGGEASREELLAARAAGKPVTFIPADMNHRLAREKARKRGLAEPTDFRGPAHHALMPDH